MDEDLLLNIKDVLPLEFQSLFNKKYEKFNYMQSILFSQAFGSDVYILF
jgi:hypothetical protein